ncbi:MAG: hypothetical protein GF387_03045 [Candidatus Portnoybacteria bacterium]|nr:hypothetical protein [Candidatus Portnoybacteria bacterium]
MINQEYQNQEPRKTNPKKKWIILILIIVILSLPLFYMFKTGFALSKIIDIKNISWESIFGEEHPSEEYTPLKQENRMNFLLLGIRGEGDPNGGLLSDGIMIISYKKDTQEVAVFSIPRDLYLQMPGEIKYEKINAAYAIGLEKYDNGLNYAKKTIAYVSGLHLDYAAIVDFEAFKDIIDLLGGITIHLDEPFEESQQWLCDEQGQNCEVFRLEAGTHTLNGEIALLYARSRFSSNDFDRARRQQQVLLALKDKITKLNILKDPVKISGIIDVLSDNIRTDVSPWEIPDLLEIAKNANIQNIQTRVFRNSESGTLYETTINGRYVLLPKAGDFTQIRNICQNIFEK